jgi:hypothetical protein
MRSGRCSIKSTQPQIVSRNAGFRYFCVHKTKRVSLFIIAILVVLYCNLHGINSFNEGSVSTQRTQSKTYDRRLAIQYVQTYAEKFNPQYRIYRNGPHEADCTNFVSQAMVAGGWQSALGFYKSDKSWWYAPSGLWPRESLSWANANKFIRFALSQHRVRTVQHLATLVPGDLIAIDFDPDNGNGFDHIMFVSKKDGKNELYLTSRSFNIKDKLLSVLRAKHKTAVFYGFAVEDNL